MKEIIREITDDYLNVTNVSKDNYQSLLMSTLAGVDEGNKNFVVKAGMQYVNDQIVLGEVYFGKLSNLIEIGNTNLDKVKESFIKDSHDLKANFDTVIGTIFPGIPAQNKPLVTAVLTSAMNSQRNYGEISINRIIERQQGKTKTIAPKAEVVQVAPNVAAFPQATPAAQPVTPQPVVQQAHPVAQNQTPTADDNFANLFGVSQRR